MSEVGPGGLRLTLEERRINAKKLLDHGYEPQKVAHAVNLPTKLINIFIETGIIEEEKGYFDTDQDQKTEYVYVIGCGSHGVKIGTSHNPEERRDSLQTGSPIPLEILNTIESSEASRLESSLHERYSQYRLSGEWFDLPAEELDVLTEIENEEDLQ